MLKPGLYEQIITRQIRKELAGVSEKRRRTERIEKVDASRVLAQYLGGVIRQGLDTVMDRENTLESQIALVNRIVALVRQEMGEQSVDLFAVDEQAEQLLVLLRENDPALVAGKTALSIPRPETSIARSSLFTGAIHEPQMYSELRQEIGAADRIDMLVSFIRWSGLRLLMDALQAFTEHGGQLRVITTSYMGATDLKAV